jgi:hypothetical protein
MNTSLVSRTCTLTVAAFAGLTISSSAALVGFDIFDTYTTGPLNGKGPAGNVWTAQPATTVVDAGGGDLRASLTGPSAIPNYRSLTPAGLSIVNASTAATVYWNFTISAATTGNNWNFVITDDGAPADTAGSSEVQFNYDAGAGSAFRARDAGAFEFLSLSGTVGSRLLPISGILYNAWFEINNSANTYQVFLQSDGDPLIATRTLMLADNGSGATFGFRNGGANDLITANMGSGNAGSIVTFDDIYVDTAGFNSANPTVPEPAVAGLLALAAFATGLRRRRS